MVTKYQFFVSVVLVGVIAAGLAGCPRRRRGYQRGIDGHGFITVFLGLMTYLTLISRAMSMTGDTFSTQIL